ncbi:MAG: hypothetical protein ACK4M8_02170 [Allorhizobium sp.]
MKIEDINAVELAAATAHMAAGQFFAVLTDGQCWVSPEMDNNDVDSLQKAVLALGEYACTRELVPGQLMSFAGIERILEIDDDLDLHRTRAWAYDIFTVAARHTYQLTIDEQNKIAEDKAFEERQAAIAPLKIEDSIFEPHGSLGDMEDYQKQFLEDSEKEQQRLLEEQQKAAMIVAGEALAVSVGGAPAAEPSMPAMTLGQTIPTTTDDSEGGDEKETADPGQEAGGAPAPAGEASDALRADRDDGSAQADPEGLPAGDIPSAGEAGEAAEVPGDDAPGEVSEEAEGDPQGEAEPKTTTTTKGGKKPAKGKSAD